jgi:hypothetical protein
VRFLPGPHVSSLPRRVPAPTMIQAVQQALSDQGERAARAARGVYLRARSGGANEVRVVLSSGAELLIVADPSIDSRDVCRRARRYLDDVDPTGAVSAPTLRLHA